jgi:hypothetical protein
MGGPPLATIPAPAEPPPLPGVVAGAAGVAAASSAAASACLAAWAFHFSTMPFRYPNGTTNESFTARTRTRGQG